MDTGVGTTIAPIWFGSDGDLGSLLQEVRVSTEEIDTVVITHIHDDHIGGTVTREGTVTFPGAQHLIQHPGQLACPDWSNLADEEPCVAAASRRAILSELALRPNTIVAPTHFVEAFGTIGFIDGTVWLPLDRQVEPA